MFPVLELVLALGLLLGVGVVLGLPSSQDVRVERVYQARTRCTVAEARNGRTPKGVLVRKPFLGPRCWCFEGHPDVCLRCVSAIRQRTCFHSRNLEPSKHNWECSAFWD